MKLDLSRRSGAVAVIADWIKPADMTQYSASVSFAHSGISLHSPRAPIRNSDAKKHIRRFKTRFIATAESKYNNVHDHIFVVLAALLTNSNEAV